MRTPSKTIAVAANVIFILGVIGAGWVRTAGLWWTTILVAAAMMVILGLLLRDGRRWPARAAYCAVVLQIANCVGIWIHSFYMTSQLSPPMETTFSGGLAAINLLALLSYRPLYPARWMTTRRTLGTFACGVVIAGLIGGIALTSLIRRISTQSQTAQLFVRVGGGVYWENGWVVRLDLKGSGTTNDDLPHLRTLPQLHELSLANTLVNDNGIVHLRSLTQLQKLELPRKRISAHSVMWLKGELPSVDIRTL